MQLVLKMVKIRYFLWLKMVLTIINMNSELSIMGNTKIHNMQLKYIINEANCYELDEK